MSRPVKPAQVSLGFQTDKTVDEYAALAMMAETYGFDGVSVFSDLFYQPAIGPLLAMAQHTTRIRLGPACLNPYMLHPVEIAGQIAALDAASRGRAYLGLARGSWLQRVGVRQPRPLRALRETLDIVALLLAGDRGGYAGDLFHLEAGTGLRYTPLRPQVDVLLGLWGPKGAALAAECADEVKVGGTANPQMVRVMRRRLDAGCADAGRPDGSVSVVAGAVTVVDEDGTAARRRARVEVAMYLAVVAALDPTVEVPEDLLAAIRTRVDAGAHEEAGRLVPDELLAKFAFAGTPSDVADQAQALFDAGAARVEFGTPHGLTDAGGVELLGKEVLPALR